jgi:hypothetical protein
MFTTDKESRMRLALAALCFAALGVLYFRAMAGAAGYGTYASLAGPWRNIGSDLLMFALSGACLVLLSAFVRGGSMLQRTAAILLAVLPVVVISHFLSAALNLCGSHSALSHGMETTEARSLPGLADQRPLPCGHAPIP